MYTPDKILAKPMNGSSLSPERGVFVYVDSGRLYDVISGSGDIEGSSQCVALEDGNHLISGGNSEQRGVNEHVVAQSSGSHFLHANHAALLGGACCREHAVGTGVR